MEYSKFNLGWNIEKYRGPYPTDSIVKLFVLRNCQGNVEVFGFNAGSQCLAIGHFVLSYTVIISS